MRSDRQSNLFIQLALIVGVLLVVGGLGWLIVLGNRAPSVAVAERVEPTVAAPQVAPPQQSEVESPTVEPSRAVPESTEPEPTAQLVASYGANMGTGSTEFSAVAFNEAKNRLVIASDEDVLFEFDLDSDGLPVIPPRRAIRVAHGAGDIEGLHWLDGTTYVLAHENDGGVTVVEIPEGVERLEASLVVSRFESGITEENGNGIEGIAGLPGSDDFMLVHERPPTLIRVTSTGERLAEFRLDGIIDASDVWVGPNDVYWVVSDENRGVRRYRVGGPDELELVGELLLTLEAGRFAQAEGIVGNGDGSKLYVVGEAPDANSLVFAVWSFES
jgi:uncharacterized protein YjiK